jgi:hypothetical protein
MSLSILNSLVDEMVDKFAGLVSEKYDIPKEDIIDLLKTSEEKTTVQKSRLLQPKPEKNVVKSKSTTPTTPITSSEISEFSEEDLIMANKKQLSAWCRMKGYKVSGTRAELMTRLLGKEPVKTTAPRKRTAAKKKGPGKDQAQNLVNKLVGREKENLSVRRNAFGNYEHAETGLIFDPSDKSVVGKQSKDDNGNGVVLPLTAEDIDTCNRYNFEYRLPENLGVEKESLDGVTVEGMGENEEMLEEEEEEEEYEEVYEEYVEE